jgi:hypothetical protein
MRLFAIFLAALMVTPAAANPLLPPSVNFVADVEITRDSDHSVAVPARYVYGGRRIRIEYVGIVTLVDLDRKQTTAMIPRVKTYWTPHPITDGADVRRWVGVEAQSAEPIGQGTLLGRPVTKYRVRGTIFETRTPFEGEVWTTAENIVVRVEGTSRTDGLVAPVKVTTVQLVTGPVDTKLLAVPATFARAPRSDPGPRQQD